MHFSTGQKGILSLTPTNYELWKHVNEQQTWKTRKLPSEKKVIIQITWLTALWFLFIICIYPLCSRCFQFLVPSLECPFWYVECMCIYIYSIVVFISCAIHVKRVFFLRFLSLFFMFLSLVVFVWWIVSLCPFVFFWYFPVFIAVFLLWSVFKAFHFMLQLWVILCLGFPW